MKPGEIVTVRLWGGKTGVRRVIEERRSVIVICSEDEWQTAKLEGRDPIGLGFPRVDVIVDASEVQP